MRRTIRGILGAGLMVVGILVVGLATVSAQASSSSSTTLNLSVGSTVSMTGLAATYNVTAPAGVVTNVDTGPMTIATNDSLGYTLLISATGANFVGLTPSNTIPITDDALWVCFGASFGSCGPGGTASTTPTAVFGTTAASAGDIIGIRHAISVPATQPADTYSDSFTYTAQAN